jgi:hypothetical protein
MEDIQQIIKPIQKKEPEDGTIRRKEGKVTGQVGERE